MRGQPQVNGVVRSLQSLAGDARKLGAEVEFLTPEGFSDLSVADLPEHSLAAFPTLARNRAADRDDAAPDCLHIATEGPIGQVCAAAIASHEKYPFTTSYMTRFPE